MRNCEGKKKGERKKRKRCRLVEEIQDLEIAKSRNKTAKKFSYRHIEKSF
jgi:hypothetical protein